MNEPSFNEHLQFVSLSISSILTVLVPIPSAGTVWTKNTNSFFKKHTFSGLICNMDFRISSNELVKKLIRIVMIVLGLPIYLFQNLLIIYFLHLLYFQHVFADSVPSVSEWLFHWTMIRFCSLLEIWFPTSSSYISPYSNLSPIIFMHQCSWGP